MLIFDLDGTITDSNGLWVEVDCEFLRRRGLATTREYQDEVGRCIFPKAAEYTRAYYGLADDPADIMAEWETLAGEYYANTVALKPGAESLLTRCRARGLSATLFTACRPALCTVALERFGLKRYFEHVVYAEEIGLQKHDPQCFVRLCQLIGSPPVDCVLFDDNPSNCATARAAGMGTVGVYDEFYAHRQEELRAVADRYVRSLEEI